MTKIRHSTITYTLTTHILTTELDFSNTILGRFCHLKKSDGCLLFSNYILTDSFIYFHLNVIF